MSREHAGAPVGRRTFLTAAGGAAVGAMMNPGGASAMPWRAMGSGSGSAAGFRFVATGQALIAHDLREIPYPGYAEVREVLGQADACFTNLEATIHGPGAGEPTKSGTFFHAAQPVVLDCLKDLGFNLLALSNNHAWDLGDGGILSTIAAVRERGIVHAGTGANLAAAAAPAFLPTARGRVGLVSVASRVGEEGTPYAIGAVAGPDTPGVNHLRVVEDRPDPADARRVLGAIEEAAASADWVIYYQHCHYYDLQDWRRTPEWRRAWARACVDAGAHAVVTHGVPLLHGVEVYRGRPILYGLGSLIFHSRTAPGYYTHSVWQSAIADCTFEDGRLTSLRLWPVLLSEGMNDATFLPTRGRPSLRESLGARPGYEAQMILENLSRISAPYGTEMRVAEGGAYADVKV